MQKNKAWCGHEQHTKFIIHVTITHKNTYQMPQQNFSELWSSTPSTATA